MSKIELRQSFTYDDVLLRPGHSEVLPSEVEVKGRFSRNIIVNVPIISAAMDTVTEYTTAIVLAQQGGIGVIHKNMSAADQAREVAKVKKYEAGMIFDPITVHPELSLKAFMELSRKHKITGFPVVNDDNVLVGILTGRDIQFETNLAQKVKDIMTQESNLSPRRVTISKRPNVFYTNTGLKNYPWWMKRGV